MICFILCYWFHLFIVDGAGGFLLNWIELNWCHIDFNALKISKDQTFEGGMHAPSFLPSFFISLFPSLCGVWPFICGIIGMMLSYWLLAWGNHSEDEDNKLSRELERNMTDAWQNVHALVMMSSCIDYYFPLTPAITYIFNAIQLKNLKHLFSLFVPCIYCNINVHLSQFS